ncbi:MAG: RNA polymerase sigma factor [Hyphomicrobiales bacterium]|nr:MAG: RNA polymerase sigma factor [Hyphomicrobiales bacterium]
MPARVEPTIAPIATCVRHLCVIQDGYEPWKGSAECSLEKVPAVSDANRAALRDLLVSNYEMLSQRLTRRLGSADVAHDALHETFLRLQQGAEIADVRSPTRYLLRIALNIAADRRRSEARVLTAREVDTLLEIPDETPDQERVASARSELEALARAMATLPERQRTIFNAALIDNVPRREIARRFGVSVRTVDLEIQRALEQCVRWLAERSTPQSAHGKNDLATD